MKSHKTWYRMAVLTYFRCEWTDVSRDDNYGLRLTPELKRLIGRCYEQGTPVPNAAKEVGIFLEITEERT